jgi:putative zinc finger/helix-turn-helix YgiT family protein
MQNCPACQRGELIAQYETRTFNPPSSDTPVEVLMGSSRCNHCNAEVTTRVQRLANLSALAARKASYGEWLMGEEVLMLRRRYGITQQQASELFGKGKIAFSRYETEASYPDLTMAKLMNLALTDASVMKQLAVQAGMELPLVEKRLTAAFLQTLAENEKTRTKVEPASDTTVNSSITAGAINGFFAKLLGSINQSLAPDKVQLKDKLVGAANDERFALAA